MGLFGKSCPLEKSHIAVYGVHSPRKWKKEDCQTCEYYQDNTCSYKKTVVKIQASGKRGYPALVKKSMMDKPAEIRERSEKEAVLKGGYSPDEQKEYWAISREYDLLWNDSSPQQREDILDSLDQWKIYLESGSGPAQAHEKVKEWLKQREEFRRQ
ncbi:MAG: hypothetical protein JXA46_07210 [Dehalococcoidales bacterium]|nr:hypothetical protein [Dehalococcoidales bacterium]